MNKKLNDVERFWSKVNKTDGCWVWKAGTDKDGYGKYQIGPHKKQKHYRAHRYSYIITYGEISNDMLVLHKCDNPPCVRPDHLFIGTQKDNREDCKNKNRTAKGDKNGRRISPPTGSKHWKTNLTEQIVLLIRNEYDNGGISQASLARKYNTSKFAIYNIVHGKSWRHI